jgi:SOS-response transcriptional repressor LexA
VPDNRAVRYICPMETPEIYDRIKQRLDEIGMSERQASIRAVGNSQLIRNIRRGKSTSPRGENIVKLAKVLGVSESWLMGTSDDPGAPVAEQPSGVRFGGIVEAGAFRPDDGLNQESEWQIVPVSPDRRYPRNAQYAFKVVGDSMTEAKIFDGMWVLAVAAEAWERIHGEPRDGALVVVARTRDGNPERELTVKRLRIFRDRIELQPQSGNPAYAPIVFPLPSRDDERSEARVIAVVIASSWLYG